MYRIVNTLSVILVIGGWWRATAAYENLPHRIPIHFNLLGRPDGWGGRWMIWFLPFLSLVLSALWLFAFAGLRGARVTTAGRLPSSLLLLAIVGSFLYINQKIVDCAVGESSGLGWGFLPLFLLLIFGLSTWLTIVGG